jgi:flagellar motor switch protein FliG
VTPIPKTANSPGAEPAPLPGYVPKNQEKPIDYVQKDQEQTIRTSGFIIKSIHASVVLDASLPEAQVNEVRSVLPDLLRMESDRGDTLQVVRANLPPPWKAVARTNEGMLTIFVILSIVFLVMLVAILAYMTAMRLMHSFVSEMAASRRLAASQLPPGGPFGGLPAGAGGALPELLPGGMPPEGGAAGDEQETAAGETPALGRRFDFLNSKEPAEMADLLAGETPEDLALLFAYLSESNPDLATRVFSSFPAAMQSSISQALVHLRMADPERLAMLENRIKTTMDFGVRGPERLGRILSRLPAPEREELLMGISAQNSEDAQQVERFMLPFEELGNLKPGDLRRLLVAVPFQEWGRALRGAPQQMVDRVLAELPAGTRQIVREAMEVPQPRDKVLDSRSKILASAQALAAKGQITIGREGASSEMI